MYNERQRYQSEESFLPSRTNLVVKSLESIEESIKRNKWDRVTSSFEETSEYLHELSTVGARKLSHFVVEPYQSENNNTINNVDIPFVLTAFFPKEKEMMDNSLVDSHSDYNNDSGHKESCISKKDYDDSCRLIEARNEWCNELVKEIKTYKEQKKQKRDSNVT